MKVPKKSPIALDKLKYLRDLQRPASYKLPLEKRGVKTIPPTLAKYIFNPRQVRKVKLQAAAKGSGSQSNHERVFRNLENFLAIEKDSLKDLDSDKIIDYLDFLDDQSEKYNYVRLVKPAVKFLELALNLDPLWPADVQTAYQGLCKRAACEKPPLKKGRCLPLSVLENALRHHIIKDLKNPSRVSFFKFSFL
jgi:hypothetical protein